MKEIFNNSIQFNPAQLKAIKIKFLKTWPELKEILKMSSKTKKQSAAKPVARTKARLKSHTKCEAIGGGCSEPAIAKKLCWGHYQYRRRNPGRPLKPLSWVRYED